MKGKIMKYTLFSLEPVGSREIIKSWLYPTDLVEQAGHRPPDEVLAAAAARPDLELCERAFGDDGHRISEDPGFAQEKLIHRVAR